MSWLRSGPALRDLVVAGLLVAAALALLVWTSPSAWPAALAGAVIVAFAAGTLVGRARGRAAEAKLSAEIGLVCERLLRLEARGAEPRAALPRTQPDAMGGVIDDVGLLSGLVRDLAETVASHDRQLLGLQDRAEARPPAPRPNAEPVEAPPARPAPERIAPSLLPFLEPFDAAPRPRQPASAAARSDPVLEALDAGSIEYHLQPIVSLPQRHTRLYEVFARLRVGETLVMPGDFIPVLERSGRMPDLDRLVVARALAIARHLSASGKHIPVSVNVTSAALASAAWRNDIERLAGPSGPIHNLVFELPRARWERLGPSEQGTIERLQDLGIGFAIDDSDGIPADVAALRSRRIRYLKVRAEGLLDAARHDPRRLQAGLLDLSQGDILLVADRVEHEGHVPDLIDLDIPLAQGFAFAPPRPLRTDLAPPGRPPDAEPRPDGVEADDRGPAHGDAPRSLRDVLRRAG